MYPSQAEYTQGCAMARAALSSCQLLGSQQHPAWCQCSRLAMLSLYSVAEPHNRNFLPWRQPVSGECPAARALMTVSIASSSRERISSPCSDYAPFISAASSSCGLHKLHSFCRSAHSVASAQCQEPITRAGDSSLPYSPCSVRDLTCMLASLTEHLAADMIAAA